MSTESAERQAFETMFPGASRYRSEHDPDEYDAPYGDVYEGFTSGIDYRATLATAREAELLAEVERLKEHAVILANTVEQVEREKWSSEVERLRVDAARYVALRRALYRDDVVIGEAVLSLSVGGTCPDEDEFDAAIDSARAALKDKPA